MAIEHYIFRIVSSSNLEKGDVAILLRGLSSHAKLQSLEVTGNHCGPETFEALHRIFAVASSTSAETRQFKHLKLSFCPTLDVDGFVKLLQPSNPACAPTTTAITDTAVTMKMPTVITQSSSWCPLESLDLSWNGLGSAGANVLLRTLLKSGQKCPHLNQIDDFCDLMKDLLLTRNDQEQHSGTEADTTCFPCPLRTLELGRNDCAYHHSRHNRMDEDHPTVVCVFKLLEVFPSSFENLQFLPCLVR